jgi:hypothetical protein
MGYPNNKAILFIINLGFHFDKSLNSEFRQCILLGSGLEGICFKMGSLPLGHARACLYI